MDKPKLIISSVYAAILTIAFVVVITIWAEFAPLLKNWFTNFSGHHWTSKSILSVLIYMITMALLYLLPQKHTEDRLQSVLGFLLAVTVLGTIVLLLFFTGHHFHFF